MRCQNPFCFCRTWLLLVAAVAAIGSVHAIARQPATAPTTKPDAPDLAQPAIVSKSRVQQMRAVTYCHTTIETTLKDIGPAIKTAFEPIDAAIKDGKLKPAGPALLVYHGVNGDQDHKFTADIGFPVADDAVAFGDFKVDKLPEFHCVAVLYAGPNKDQAQAWESLFGDLFAAGMEPTDETREEILKYDGEDSSNNVSLIEAGVK